VIDQCPHRSFSLYSPFASALRMSEQDLIASLRWNNNVSGSSIPDWSVNKTIMLNIRSSSNHYPGIIWVPSVAFANLVLLLSIRVSSVSVRERGNKWHLFYWLSTHYHDWRRSSMFGSVFNPLSANDISPETDYQSRKDHVPLWHAFTLLWASPCQVTLRFFIVCFARFDILVFFL